MVGNTPRNARSVRRGAFKRNCAWSLRCLLVLVLGLFSSSFLGARLALRGAGSRAVRLRRDAAAVRSVCAGTSGYAGSDGADDPLDLSGAVVSGAACLVAGSRIANSGPTSTGLGAALLTPFAYGSLAADPASLFWLALALMVLGHSLFRPGLHVLLARAMGNEERARERGFHGTTSPRTSATRWARCSENGPATFGWGALFCGAAMASLLGAGLLLAAPSESIDTSESALLGAQPAAEEGQGNMAAVWLLCSVAVVFWLTAQQAGGALMVSLRATPRRL